jgi:hypothetical protein
MNEKQTELKAFLTTGLGKDVTASLPDGDLIVTHTAAEWVAIGDTQAIGQIVNSLAVGDELGLTITQGVIPSSSIQAAITRGKDFPGALSDRSMSSLNFALRPEQFDMSDEAMVETIVEILQPTHNGLSDAEKPDSALSNFNALRQRTASIADYFGGVSQADIQAIVAPD